MRLTLVIAIIIFTILPVRADWRIENGTLTVDGDYNYSTEGQYPWYNKDFSVVIFEKNATVVGQSAFSFNLNIRAVIIKNSVTTIGDYVFESCYNLERVVISDSVTSMGAFAFKNCHGLKTLKLPNKLKTIENETFFGCDAISSVTIPKSVNRIEENAFSMCDKLKELIFEGSPTSVDVRAFAHCDKLETIICRDAPPTWDGRFFDYYTFFLNLESTEVKIPGNKIAEYKTASIWKEFNSIKSLSYALRYKVSEFLWVIEAIVASNEGAWGDIVIPSEVVIKGKRMPVTAIEDGAFNSCDNLESVTIPHSVREVGRSFMYCKRLKSVKFETAKPYYDEYGIFHYETEIQTIEMETFYNCKSLDNVYLPSGISKIGVCAFGDCSNLKQIILAATIETIEKRAFVGCENLINVISYNPFPPEVESTTFKGVDLKKVTLVVPSGAIERYKAAPVWNEFGNIVGINLGRN